MLIGFVVDVFSLRLVLKLFRGVVMFFLFGCLKDTLFGV